LLACGIIATASELMPAVSSPSLHDIPSPQVVDGVFMISLAWNIMGRLLEILKGSPVEEKRELRKETAAA
jgi:hypothetical protein